jgi:hypothetical protein
MTHRELMLAWEGHLERMGARPFGGMMTIADLEHLEAHLRERGQI